MLAKDLIELLQHVSPDTEVCALAPKGIQSPWLLLRDYSRSGSHIIHIEGMGEQPREYYIVQYGPDSERLPGPSEYLVTPEDVRACACILRAGKCDSRKEMQEKIELKQCAKYKSENEVWAEIREKLQNPIRLDKLNEWIRRRPPVYAETYNKMRSRGETVEERSAEKKRGRIVRLATDEERQKAEEERQKAKASVFDRSTPQEYPDCTEQERQSRAQKYIEKFLQDHHLSALAFWEKYKCATI